MANLLKDVVLDSTMPSNLLARKHLEFLLAYGKNTNDYEYCMTEYLRMSGMYWVLTSVALLDRLGDVNKEDFMGIVNECFDKESGGFGAAVGHDPHILYTLSAVQIACILECEDSLPCGDIVEYIRGLMQDDGSFVGDKWGEVDTRFSFCAVATLSLLGRLDAIDVVKATEFVMKCQNFDGGFGCKPEAESHAGLTYCCVGFLSIVGELCRIDRDLLGWWLCERQLPSGGLNGRPEKLPDVCYSWWVLASLRLLGRDPWISRPSLERYILATQDAESGGFSDRPGDVPDPFHTLFGLAGLSILGQSSILKVNPTYCMPQFVIDRLKLKPMILKP